MARIILFTAANQQTGEPRKVSALGHRPAQWCQDNLKLEPDPIQLGTNIQLRSNQHVFVKVDQEEGSPLQPGLYPSDRTPTEVTELLRDL
jgi:hypothetical protein